jgi:hypothetical protein
MARTSRAGRGGASGALAKVIGELQRGRSKKFGQGRALHRKHLLAATGTLEVLDRLPDHARPPSRAGAPVQRRA